MHTIRPGAPYFLKVYGLNGPEVRGHALNSHDELEIPPGALLSIESPHVRLRF
jgi:hypothetical protein